MNRDPDAAPETGSACDGLTPGARCGLSRICIEGQCTLERCGDGFVALNELCDDGNESNEDDCSIKCIPTTCGNSMPDPGEDCDDGNQEDGDGCPATCRGPVCGDGKIEGDEQCEWPQVALSSVEESYGCTANCQKDYACEECQRKHCVTYELGGTSVDAVTGCLGQAEADAGSSDGGDDGGGDDEADASASDAGAADTGSSDAGDTSAERCVAVVNCAFRNGCGFDTDAGASPALDCFCGSATSEACRAQGPASDGVCSMEIKAAAGGDVGSDVTARVTDRTTALGWANALLSCYRDHCTAECAPRTSQPDAGTQADAGTELDAGTQLDADMQLDAGTGLDGATQLDGDTQPDATQLDGDTQPDAGEL